MMESKVDNRLLFECALPDKWRIEPLKHHVSMSKGLSVQKTDLVDDGVAIISYGQIHSKSNTTVDLKDEFVRYIPRSLAPLYSSSKLQYGDVVFADTSEDVDGIGNAILNTRQSEIYAGYHTVACRPNPKTLNGKFFAYLTKTDYWRSQLRKLAMGVKVFSITQSVLSRSYVLLPPLEEQRIIAQLLDELTLPLDSEELLLTQQIDALERYKRSLIHEAVTKGLNPNAPMKPSGIEWIGDIPEHWNTSKLKYLLESPLQYGSNEAGNPFLENAPRYIRITDITTDGNLKSENAQYLDLKLAYPFILSEGDVLFARSGATVGKTFLYHESDGWACFAGYLIRAKSNKKKVLPAFLYYFTQGIGYGNWVSRMYSQATIQNIGADKYSLLIIPLPQISEQQTIVDYLDGKCAKVDAILEIKRQQIEVLKKRRQSLIYEYVTGKRRVGEDS